MAEDLGKLDPWFGSFTLSKAGWRVFLKFFASELEVINRNGHTALVPAELESRSFVEESIKLIENNRRNGLNDEDSRANFEDLAATQLDSGAYFFAALCEIANLPNVNMDSFVREFMFSQDKPIASEDIIAHAIRIGVEIEEKDFRTIGNIMIKYGVPISRSPTKYVTKRAYISETGIGINEISLRSYCDDFYRHWLEKFKEARVFHAEEIQRWSVERGYPDSITGSSWLAVAPLRFDPEQRFSGDKLKIWLAEHWGNSTPPTLKKLIETLLKIRGEPMSTKEIRMQLLPDRGVGDVFQIFESARVQQTGANQWRFKAP